MKIYNYYLHGILEGKGISNVVKDLSTSLLASIFKNKFTDFIFDAGLVKLSPIKIFISHEKKNYHIQFYSKTSSLNDIEITFDIPDNPNPGYLHELIIHEMTHLWEFYNITILNEKLPMYSKLKKCLNRTLDQDKIDILSEFRYIIYLTLDNELNARVAQLYQYLKLYKTKDKEQLLKLVKNSSSWKKMEIIKNFDNKRYLTNVLDTLGEDLSIIMFNNLNKELLENEFNKPFIKEIVNVSNLNEYLKCWSDVFKYKMKKHESKLLRIIDVIIEE